MQIELASRFRLSPTSPSENGAIDHTQNKDVITLRPARPDWLSLAKLPTAERNFLRERPAVIDHAHKKHL